MKKILCLLPMLFIAACSLLSASPASAQAASAKIRLTGPAIARVRPEGSAEIRVDARRKSFRVEVNRVNLANGSTMVASVNGVAVGSFVLTAGVGRMELQSERGQSVPAIKTGDIVAVTAPNGSVILTGQF